MSKIPHTKKPVKRNKLSGLRNAYPVVKPKIPAKRKKAMPKEDWVLPEAIEDDIVRLRKLAPVKRDPIYRYLKEILITVTKWKASKNWKETEADLGAFYEKYLSSRIEKNHFRVLIEMTARDHTKDGVKAKHLAVLKYAMSKRVTPDTFYKFVDEFKSINAIVEAARDAKNV